MKMITQLYIVLETIMVELQLPTPVRLHSAVFIFTFYLASSSRIQNSAQRQDVPPWKCRENISNQATIISFHVLFNSPRAGCRNGKDPDSYSRGFLFEYRPEYILSWLRGFVIFLQSLQTNVLDNTSIRSLTTPSIYSPVFLIHR
jgi:hypothetical protein